MDKKEVRLNAEKRKSLVIDFRKHCESLDTHEKRRSYNQEKMQSLQ